MMTEENIVSIVIPVYNRADLLRECLVSVARQTYPFIEVIVIDDASTEDLKSVIDTIKWPTSFTYHYIRLDENQGPGYAREVGRLRATGNFINYLDSDDLFHPEKIKRQVALLNSHPEVGMCYCISLNFTAIPFDGSETIRRSYPTEKILPALLEKRPWTTCSCLWTRTATNIIGPWFHGRIGEDTLYELTAGCKDIPIIFLPEKLCFCRDHPGQPEQRAPSIQKYYYAISAYQEMLNVLVSSGKLDDKHNLYPLVREIFRVCRKLFGFRDTRAALSIMQYLVQFKQVNYASLGFFFLSIKTILSSRNWVWNKLQPFFFENLCLLTLIVEKPKINFPTADQ